MTKTLWFKAYQLVCKWCPNDPSLSLLECVHSPEKGNIHMKQLNTLMGSYQQIQLLVCRQENLFQLMSL